jgi:hypothetical protein
MHVLARSVLQQSWCAEHVAAYLTVPDLIAMICTGAGVCAAFDRAEVWHLLLTSLNGLKQKERRRAGGKFGRQPSISGAKQLVRKKWQAGNCNLHAVCINLQQAVRLQLEQRIVLKAVKQLLCKHSQGCCKHEDALSVWLQCSFPGHRLSSYLQLQRGLGEHAVHTGIACSRCRASPVIGTCYRCTLCTERRPVNLCGQCYAVRAQHHQCHSFAQLSSRCETAVLRQVAHYEAM